MAKMTLIEDGNGKTVSLHKPALRPEHRPSGRNCSRRARILLTKLGGRLVGLG